MTPKESRFCVEYTIDGNATRAAKDAGYSPKTAYAAGCRLLKKPDVKVRIAELRADQLQRLKATADDAEIEMRRIALYDPADYIDVKSPDDVAALPEDKRRAIVGWSWDRNGNFTLRFAKTQGLEMLGRRHGLFKEKVEHTGKNGGPIQIEGGGVSGLLAATLAEAADDADHQG
jgi:phage terminase small subunit